MSGIFSKEGTMGIGKRDGVENERKCNCDIYEKEGEENKGK